MNRVILKRKTWLPTEVLGEFQNQSGDHLFDSLERCFEGLPKIPAGEYTCIRFHSPHLGYEVFMLQNVPGHDHILIHIANYETDLNGCIGIGKDFSPMKNGEEMLTVSKVAFTEFMQMQAGLATFKLVVQD